MTQWGNTIDKDNVLQEYPRPNLVRESYLNLNGLWEYAISRSKEVTSYDGKILVPFSPETYLSGVERIVKPEEYLHYRKTFSVPDDFVRERVLLHFGAVDQECEVYLNGIYIGDHRGGYLPFRFEVTNQLQKGVNTLTLRVKDRTEYAPHARGKQKLIKKGKMSSLFYTPQSGIWKTVWMESVPELYIEDLKITPLFDEKAVKFYVCAKRREEMDLKILADGKTIVSVTARSNEEVVVSIPNMHPWTTEDPYLYDVKITLGNDQVSSYFGMRKVSVERDGRGILRFFLNHKPFFYNGILDQGYWPEGLMTAPSDAALIYDIRKLKELGYNTIRKHVKVETERFYYHCDRLGMMVWQDMPNGGGDYRMWFVTYLPNGLEWLGRTVKDHHYRLFQRSDKAGRKQYYEDLEGMISLLYHHPSIAVWVPFNEGWGQFDASEATARIRNLDHTRLVNEACGWYDQHGGDIYSIHNYLRKLKVKAKDRVVALTEYGGYTCPVRSHMACEKKFGYQHYHSEQELTENYRRLWKEEIFPNIERGLSGIIYTQISDIEEEINGLMTYDRQVSKFNEEVIRTLNQRLYQYFEKITADSGVPYTER